MPRGKRRGKVDLDEEKKAEDAGKSSKSFLTLSSSDDEEANEDPRLKNVEKALLMRAAKLAPDDAILGETSGGGSGSSAVVALSSSSVLDEEVVEAPGGVGGSDGIVSSGKKKVLKRVRIKKMEVGEQTVIVAKDEEKEETVKASDTVESVEPTAVEITDNIVFRKLLRGPRYFDPPDSSSWGKCFNCGEEGHTIAKCTAVKRKKACFVCGSLEHSAKQCSKGQDCFICKKGGHRAKDCPEKHKGGSLSLKICLKCGDSGHDMFSCWNDYYSPDDLMGIQCYICKGFGHLCCANSVKTSPGVISCYKCGQLGHTGLACAKIHGEDIGTGSSSSCYKCGEEGHFARECMNSAEVLQASPLSREWEDYYSSVPAARLGVPASELTESMRLSVLKEAFAFPWEVDAPASPLCGDRDWVSPAALVSSKFLPVEWEDYYSSVPAARLGVPTSELTESMRLSVLKEAFSVPWEVDAPASPLCGDRDWVSPAALVSSKFLPVVVPASPPPDGVSGGSFVVPSDVVAPAMGCVGLPVSSPVFPVGVLVSPTEGVASISPVEASASPAIAAVSLGTVGEAPASELVAALSVRNPIPAKGLIRRGFFGPSGISHPLPEDDGSKGAPVLSSVSKSQLGYSRRRKDKLAQQPPYSEEMLEAMKLMGISVSGKDERKCLALLSAIDKEHKKEAAAVQKELKREAATQRVKGTRKLKNLECSMVL
jgi:hypothetical protein